MDRELLQDSDAVNESFWDGLGVEFEAKYIFDFRSAPRRGSVCGGLKQGSTRKKVLGNLRNITGGQGNPCVEPGFRPA